MCEPKLTRSVDPSIELASKASQILSSVKINTELQSKESNVFFEVGSSLKLTEHSSVADIFHHNAGV